jgi:hypothetical protein
MWQNCLMTETPPSILDAFAASVDAAVRVSSSPGAYRPLSDAEFASACRLSAELKKRADALTAVIAGELAHRSRPALGSDGLAQREGFRTPEEMVRVTTGSTAREAHSAVRVGRLAHAALEPADEVQRPWLSIVGSAVAAGDLSVAAAEAIASGLGAPTESVTGDLLAAAAEMLCAEASGLDADRLLVRARELRDELDEAGVAVREAELREQRSLIVHRTGSGMSRLVWLMDPETAATVGALYDRATSPRRGGPTFAGPDELVADRILADTRMTQQLASDTFLELLRQGSNADSSALLGTGAPSVRVLATDTALHSRRGRGYLEGSTAPVSIETVERLACSGSMAPLEFDAGGQPLDLGRERRLFSSRQRVALAARDGGCRFPGCERPPSWCEAHHIEHWKRDHGRTDIATGILLCRHHHLLVHNNAWEITRDAADYWLVPPPTIDAAQVPRPMPSRSPAYRQLRRELAG